ncbi:hypothetical protein [Fluviicola sp.]|uniref:hypothetical protein n=1 Tax=Fluviicola sp. TaxID=1917219 RepID=UPI0031D3CE15
MIDEQSKAYQTWKSFYGIAYFEEKSGSKFLYYGDSKGTAWNVDNISLKDSGDVHYLSWTEETGTLTKLIVVELEPHNHRRLEWVIEPAKGNCLFWVNRWTEDGLFIVYRDNQTNYALHLFLSKKPKGFSLRVTELGEMLAIKKNWTIGYKFYTDKEVKLFDLRNFVYQGTISDEEAAERGIIPAELDNDFEELE